MNALSRWLHKRRLHDDLQREMQNHLAEKIDQLREDGISEEEARKQAARQFGNLTLRIEDSRATWGWTTTEQFWQDVSYGLRVLRKAPSFTVTALVVLALGIGSNTAMFSAVKAVLLSALPYPEPERMVDLRQTSKDGHLMSVSQLDFRDWRAQTRSIETLATYDSGSAMASGTFSTRHVRMGTVGTGFFEAVATPAFIGRLFSLEEQKPGGIPTIILGYAFAASVFGQPARAIGQALRMDGMPFTVIGVMPPKFDFPEHAQAWIPNDLFPDNTARSAHNYRVLGRLRPGVTIRQAQADMDIVAARLARQYVDDRDEGIRVQSLFDSMVGSVRPALLTLSGAVVLVLLIACVNISNLLLARAGSRRKEMAMRRALGAGRTRLFRQLLTESVLLAIGGGLCGLVLAQLSVAILHAAAPANVPRLETLRIDSEVLFFTTVLSLLAGVVFGVLPALESSRADLNDEVKQGSTKGASPHRTRWSSVLVMGQVALAIVLLSAASLLMKSYWKLTHIETGLRSSGISVADITWPASADGNSVDAAYVRKTGMQMLEQIARLPGVQSAALVHSLPFTSAPDGGFEIEGRPLPADPHQYPDADYRMVTPGFLDVFAIPVLSGRGFSMQDEYSQQQVALVNQTFVKRFFPKSSALGARIRFLGFDRKPQFLSIIGILPDVRAAGLRQPFSPEVYANYFQHADTALDVSLVVRGPARLQPNIREIVTSLNRNTAVNFENMDGLISGSIARERFETTLLGVFAGCAVLLSVVGVYGLLSYIVTQRTSEMGVRLALGASATGVLRMVLTQGGVLVVTGGVFGLVGALLSTWLLEAMLFEVKASDPGVLLTAFLSFLLAALVGCYLPARRASRIQPSEALRAE